MEIIANIFLGLFFLISVYFLIMWISQTYQMFRAMKVLYITKLDGIGILVNGDLVTVIAEDEFMDGFVAGAKYVWRKAQGSNYVFVEEIENES